MFFAISNKHWTLPLDHQQQCQRQPTTGFVLIRTHQAGIVARHRYWDQNQAVLSAYALKLPFVGKVRKIDTAKSFNVWDNVWDVGLWMIWLCQFFGLYPQIVASVRMHLSPLGFDLSSGVSRLCLPDEP